MKIATLGAGMVGRTIAIDLAKDFDVTAFDINPANLQILENEHGIQTMCANLQKFEAYGEMLQGFDMVACAVPGFMGYNALKAIISAGKSVVDISFSPENLLELDAMAKANGVTAIVDCGVAPGMSNLVLGRYNEVMNITAFECMVGGLPKNPQPPYNYKAPFSPIDVIEEYTRPARLVRNGEIVTLPALTDICIENFDNIGQLESFNTDGLRSILYTMKHIPNMVEKTLRYPGHVALIKQMIEDGMFKEENIDATAKMLFEHWKLQPGEAEFTIMKIIVKSSDKAVEYFLYDEYDAITNTSSMSRTTAYTCTAAVNLIAKNMFSKKGVFPPELVGSDSQCFDFVLNYLSNRGIKYIAKEIQL